VQRTFPFVLAAISAAALVASLATGLPEPPRQDATPPARQPEGGTPAPPPDLPAESDPPAPQPRKPVTATLSEYVELVRESGGAAACRLFPDHFEPTRGKPRKPPAPDVPYPHPAPADGCRSREIAGYTQIPSAPWKASFVERIGRMRLAQGLARVALRIRTAYRRVPRFGRTPDVIERDVVWLRRQGSEWVVAQPSLLVYRVFESRGTPPAILDPPVPAESLSEPARLPAGPACPPRRQTARDPAGDAERQPSGPPAAWVDMTDLAMSRSGGELCLTVVTRAPLRPATTISLWVIAPAPTSTSADVRLDSLGRPHVTTLGEHRLRGARMAGAGSRLSIWLPARRLGLDRGRFGWSVRIRHQPGPEAVVADHAPNTRLHLYYAYPDGELITDLP
jgi:hypothetical protein